VASRLLTLTALWLCRLIALGPRWFMVATASLMGRLAFLLGHYRRGIALANLRACFPDWSQARREAVAREHFYWYARAFLERFEVWFCSKERLRKRVQLVHMEHFFEHEGRPIILLAPHFLGLDAGGVRFLLERNTITMYKKHSNPVLESWIKAGRTRFQEPLVVSRDEGFARLVRPLRKGTPFYFLPDMDLGARDSVFVPFFGVDAATVTSVVRLSRLVGAVVVPLVTRMTEEGYEARFYPGWTHPNDDSIETLEQGVAKMNQFIEQRVLEMPAQYLWTHRRFKTRPPGQPSIYG
jgi:Kdo2-lipid IVA lauroyltransferase/acyltransferase